MVFPVMREKVEPGKVAKIPRLLPGDRGELWLQVAREG